MIPSTLIYILQEGTEAVVLVYLANRLGGFFDAVFALDLEAGLGQMGSFILCILAGVILLPFLSFLGEAVMLHNALRHDKIVLERFLDKSYISAMSMDEGEVQYRLEQDPIVLRSCWQDTVTDLAGVMVAVIYLLLSALRISVVYTGTAFVVSILSLAVPVAMQKYREKYGREKRDFETKVGTNENLLSHWPCEIKLYGMGEKVLERFDAMFWQYFRKLRVPNIMAETIADSISAMLNQICTLAILLFGAWMVSMHRITPGSVAAMVGYMSVFRFIMEKLSDFLSVMPEKRNALDRMEKLYCDAEVAGGNALKGDIFRIETQGLRFAYKEARGASGENGQAEARSANGENGQAGDGDAREEDGRTEEAAEIRYPDFVLSKGDKLMVGGSNGSGKTTLLKLFCGLISGYEGNILINGMELGSFKMEGVRRNFAYVEQAPYLFQGSVLENIRIGNPEAPEEAAYRKAQELGISCLMERDISPDAGELSGGERQKIALARALMKEDRILLLDEPDNHLDDKSLGWLKDFIKNTDRTVIYITHGRELGIVDSGARMLL